MLYDVTDKRVLQLNFPKAQATEARALLGELHVEPSHDLASANQTLRGLGCQPSTGTTGLAANGTRSHMGFFSKAGGSYSYWIIDYSEAAAGKGAVVFVDGKVVLIVASKDGKRSSAQALADAIGH